MFKSIEYKVLYKRIFFTCFILLIYILGSNISIVGNKNIHTPQDSFFKLAVSNVGGDLNTLNIFSLGLGPWLSSMIIISLINYRNEERIRTQTRAERNFKERILTLIISAIQGFYVIHSYIDRLVIENVNMIILVIVLMTGTLFLVWLADQNFTYGIAGPMPLILMSIVKSMFNNHFAKIHVNALIIIGIALVLALALFILLYIELSEYRIEYKDIMNISAKDTPSYVAWKLNPAGSISVMFSLSLFLIANNVVNLIGRLFFNTTFETVLFNFSSPIGITDYVILQILLGYFLSRFLINTNKKAKDFAKSGNYFVDVYPGEQTKKFLGSKARIVCWFGSIIIAIVLAVPLYISLLVPNLYEEIFFSVQLIVFVYIGINIAETIRAYLYFDRYKQILNKYW